MLNCKKCTPHCHLSLNNWRQKLWGVLNRDRTCVVLLFVIEISHIFFFFELLKMNYLIVSFDLDTEKNYIYFYYNFSIRMNEIHILRNGPIMINLRQAGLVHRNHSRLRCYLRLQIMCVLDSSCVIQVSIINCKQI